MTAPRLELVLALEELPRLRILADTAEDQERLRLWLDRPATRRSLADAVADALEEAA